jgi:hypothetical protein
MGQPATALRATVGFEGVAELRRNGGGEVDEERKGSGSHSRLHG